MRISELIATLADHITEAGDKKIILRTYGKAHFHDWKRIGFVDNENETFIEVIE